MPSYHTKLHYPYQYAREIVETFTGSYARATNCIARICDVPPLDYVEHLIYLFMANNKMWNVVRDVVKWVEKTNQYDYLRELGDEMALEYLKVVKYTAEDLRLFEGKSIADIDTPSN